MKKAGRPTKLNQEVHDKIVLAIRSGNYIETAAAYAGIAKDILYDWLKKGARSQTNDKFKRFSNAVEKALADAEIRDVALIGKAAEKEWTAAAWRLERKFPRKWGRMERHELTGAEGGPIEVSPGFDVTRLSIEERRSFRTLLDKAKGVEETDNVPRQITG